jgi:glyoxylate reductase
MRHKVFVTRRIPDEGFRLLESSVDLRVGQEDRVLTKEEIMQGVGGCQGLLCLLTDPIDDEVMDAGDLKVISNYAVGYDNIDVEAATARGIMVTNTPVDGLRETTADFAFALLMCVARRVLEGDRLVRRGEFRGWAPLLLLGSDVHGKTIGIVGAGRIGGAIARRARGFEIRILYHDVERREDIERELGAEYASLDDLLRRSDFVTLHVPLNESTHHLIGARELEMMKPTAFLINTSRGPVVDEDALVSALKSGTIAGAALDVYEREPDVHPDLLKMDSVVLAPHMASASHETRAEMAVAAAQNLVDGLAGRRPRFLVNPEVLSYHGGE